MEIQRKEWWKFEKKMKKFKKWSYQFIPLNQSIIIHLETKRKYYQDILIFRVEFHSSKNGGNLKKK